MAKPQHIDDAAALKAMLAAYERKDYGARYRTAQWLVSDYEDEVWNIECDGAFQLDWRVAMPNGTHLTATPCLWSSLRSWLIVSSHVDFTGRQLYAPAVLRQRLQCVIHCIDYLLLNAETIGFLRSGLKGVSANDLKSMIGEIGSNRSIKTSVYGWPRRLAEFLRARITELSSDAIDQALILHPDLLGDTPDEAERLTDLSVNEVLLARAWLALRGLYRPVGNTLGYRLIPKTTSLIEDIYPHSLGAGLMFWTVPRELCLGPLHRFHTEHPRARVHSARDERMDPKSLQRYVSCIASLAVLRTDGLDAPRFTIDELHNYARTVPTKDTGRFRTLPSGVALGALRQATEYAMEFGDDLVDSYLRVAEASHRSNLSIAQFANAQDIRPYFAESVRAMGVCRWLIEPIAAGGNGAPAPLTRSQWFRSLRDNHSLYEAMRVLYGAIQIVIGLLMARRAGELLDLKSGHCLDTTETRLVFRNRKSGIGGMRETEARPIPPIGARLIKLLDRLQDGLLRIGVIEAKTSLFACPSSDGSRSLCGSRTAYLSCLDLFCDWAETPLDPEGKRYYLRQHQLRRFFAMLFFWGGGFGGMDTLRWFLCHADSRQIWHYITEATPGATIRSVAAEWGAYQIKHATGEAQCLADELEERFGTRDFSVLEEEALILHLEDLMEEGRLTIEPQFLDQGRRHRIAVLLKPKRGSL